MIRNRNHNRAIATGDQQTFSALSNRLDALRTIAGSSPDLGKRRWAKGKIAELEARSKK